MRACSAMFTTTWEQSCVSGPTTSMHHVPNMFRHVLKQHDLERINLRNTSKYWFFYGMHDKTYTTHTFLSARYSITPKQLRLTWIISFLFQLFFFLRASVCCDAPVGFIMAVTDELWPFHHDTWCCLQAQTLLTSACDYNRHAWKCGAT